jgi:transcriptional regulator with XRE-family HTH domain
MRTTIGARLRELRQARGLSQQALAGDGISPGYVSLIESGKRTPSASVVARLAERLGVPVAELLGEEDPSARRAADDLARVEVNFARLALANGDPAQAVRGLATLRLDEIDRATAGEAALVLAESLQQTGQLDRAVGVLEALTDRCRREAAWLTLMTGATVLALMYIEAGDVTRSVEVAQLALDDVRAAGLEGTEEHVRLGSVFVSGLIERGDLAYATHCVEELVEVAERVGTPRARGSVYWTAAVVAHERGRLGEAVRLTDRAVALMSEQDNSRDLPRLRLHYSWLLLLHRAPRAAEALTQLDLAEADPAMTGSRLDLGTAATFRGRAHLVLGEVDDAAEHAASALTLLGPSEHVERARALILLGDVGTAQYHLDLALESFGEAEQVLAQMKDSRTTARLWRELGDGLRQLGENQRAVGAYDRSFEILGLVARATNARAASRLAH